MTKSASDSVKWIAAVLHCVVIAVSVWGLWWWNNRQANNRGKQLSWVVKPKGAILAGERVTKERLRGQLAFVKCSLKGIHTLDDAAGRYASKTLEGAPIQAEDLSWQSPGEASGGGMLIPGEVATNHIAGLRPGMALAFVQAEDKERTMQPALSDIQKRQLALKLVAITPRDNGVTSLIVELPKQELRLAARLASGQWRPLVVGSGTSSSPGSPAKIVPEANAKPK